MAEEKEAHYFKLAITGAYGVGKSSLLLRFVDGNFSDESQSSLGVEFKIKTIKVDGVNIKLKICDTAGEERFRTVTASFYRGVHGVLFSYDVSDPESFETLHHWIEEAKLFAPEEICTMIVGNKSDLEHKVSVDQVKAFSAERNIPFVEVSAKSGAGVDDMFEKLTKAILDKMKSSGQSKSANDAKGAKKKKDEKKGGCILI